MADLLGGTVKEAWLARMTWPMRLFLAAWTSVLAFADLRIWEGESIVDVLQLGWLPMFVAYLIVVPILSSRRVTQAWHGAIACLGVVLLVSGVSWLAFLAWTAIQTGELPLEGERFLASLSFWVSVWWERIPPWIVTHTALLFVACLILRVRDRRVTTTSG